MLLMAVLPALAFVSCGDDEPSNPTLSAPEFESYAAKYNITTAGSDISSIELTSSGNYIVVNKTSAMQIAGAPKQNVFCAPFKMAGSRSAGHIISGKYTVAGDGVYNLANWATVTVVKDGESAVSIEVKYPDGTTENFNADVANQMPDSKMTDNLCRTWNGKDLRLTFKVDGRTYFDKSRPVSQIDELVRDFDNVMKSLDDEYEGGLLDVLERVPQSVIFSKAGTYMVKYVDNSLAIAKWAWADMDGGRLRYSWDYDNMYEDYMAGVVTVKFNGGNLQIVEVINDEDDYEDYEEDEPTIELTMVWNFTQE